MTSQPIIDPIIRSPFYSNEAAKLVGEFVKWIWSNYILLTLSSNYIYMASDLDGRISLIVPQYFSDSLVKMPVRSIKSVETGWLLKSIADLFKEYEIASRSCMSDLESIDAWLCQNEPIAANEKLIGKPMDPFRSAAIQNLLEAGINEVAPELEAGSIEEPELKSRCKKLLRKWSVKIEKLAGRDAASFWFNGHDVRPFLIVNGG